MAWLGGRWGGSSGEGRGAEAVVLSVSWPGKRVFED
jgi:hypothetical protein